MELRKRAIVITGATGGMGQDLCRALAGEGARLAVCGGQKEKVALLQQNLEKEFQAEVYGDSVDVTKEEQVEKFLKEAYRRFGVLHVLINLAGLSIPGQIMDTDEEVYDKLMDVNVKGIFLMSKHFVTYTGEGAQVINMGSMAGRRVNANAPLYCMAKAAVNTMSQGMAMQLAERKIRVTTLNPGGVDTPFWGDRPVKREKLLQPQDITNMVLFVLETDPRVAIHSIDFESVQMV
ncbi:MAG TPA: SDR family oxidoreductase [Candidatus Eisenbergiella stercoravium]|nr:SDR family oxidoreductase [Candidatus Eisenbergiella stercoravium]